MHHLRRWLDLTRSGRRFLTLAAAIGPFVATQARAQAQPPQPAGQGTITGRVTDAATKAPVPNVQIRMLNSGRGALTGDDGTYRLASVTAGTVTIQALRVGYAASPQRPVTVVDGGTTTADFALSIAASILDQVVVQASGETQRVREAGNLPANITGDSIPKSAVNDFSDVLAGRAPGVEIQQFSGTTGGGSEIRIRGANSASLSNAPLLIIDGVRADNNESAGQASALTGGQGPSRFDDIDPNEIENVEIVKGPAGAALYGSAGANGVIYVTTKHGHAGKARWALHADYGSVRNQTSFPGNYNIVGTFGVNGPGNGCTLDNQASGVCTNPGPVTVFNPLAVLPPFVNGYRTNFGASVSGGTDATQYFLSGDYYREQGVYANNVDRRANARANIVAHLSPTLDVTVTGGYLQGRLSLPQNDNSFFGVLGLGLLGGVSDNPTHGYFEGITPSIIAQYSTRQLVDRYTTGATGTWRPLNWLTVTGQGGVDFSNQSDEQVLPANLLVNNGPQSASGQAQAIPLLSWAYTTNLTGTASYDLTSTLHSKSSVGTQYIVTTQHQLTSSGRGLVGPVTSVGGATGSFSTAETTPLDQPTLAFFGQEELAFKDRIFLTAALRHESIKILGAPLQTVTYPSGSVSWVIGEEPFFPKTAVLSSLRLRAAAGQAGQLPTFRDAATSFTGGAVRFLGGEAPAAVLNNLGQALIPERTTEYEAGFDAGLFSDRINLTATYYNKTTHDALISVTLPASVGSFPNGASPSHFANIGATSNKGIEVGLTGTVVQSRQFTFDMTVNGSYNVNRLITLGIGVDTIRFNNGAAGQIQRFAPGFPLGGYWANPYTYTVTNGTVTSANITVNPHVAYLGPVLPPTAFSVSPAFTLFKYFRVSALFDHKDGNNIFNNTEEFRCGFVLCRGLFDKTAPAAQQAGDLAGALRLSDKYFINNAEFWKFREFSVSVTAPQSFSNRMRMSDLKFTLSGRNLHTWTPYTGFDPESNFANAGFTNTEFTTQPPVKYWIGRFDVTF